MKLRSFLLNSLLLGCLYSNTQAANLLLLNTSFESSNSIYVDTGGSGTTASITGWTLTLGPSPAYAGTAADQPGTTGRNGSNFGYLNNGTGIETASTNRAVVGSGNSYILAFLAEGDSGTTTVNTSASIRWFNSSNSFLSEDSQTFAVTDTSVFKPYSITAVAPTGAVSASAKLQVAAGQTVILDNVSLTLIPEPSAALLSLLGASVLLRRRR